MITGEAGPRHTVAVARVTIEAVTPLTIGTGGGDDSRDSVCVTDANGLPAIPGTSLAGILRQAWSADPNLQHDVEDLFGFQSKDPRADLKVKGRSSRLQTSWAQVHGVDDRPVAFRGVAIDDKVLGYLATGVTRDHVRLDTRGVVDDAGKFDETLVPAGARFTFELSIWSPRKDELDSALQLLASGSMRIGGKSRRGFGCFRVVRAFGRTFDLRDATDRTAWLSLPVGIEEVAQALPGIPRERMAAAPSPTAKHGHATARVSLMPEDFWLFGGGDPADEQARADKKPDIVPVREERIVWRASPSGERAELGARELLLPASSIKGALRHRVAFHARRHTGQFAKPGEMAEPKDPPAVVGLFGEMNDNTREEGQPGLLFSESPRFGAASPLTLELDIETASLPPEALPALDDALRDLAEGRLALGAGSNRGHGYFTGKVEWTNWERP